MSKQTNPNRTCADCLHFSACHLWERSISTSVAPKCPQFEEAIYVTLTDLHNMYLMHKGDLVPVVHGQWVTSSDIPDTLICSECGRRYDMYHFEQKDMPFCHCGAKMDGGATCE